MSAIERSARRPLVVSRVVEQGVIGLGSLALARYVGVDDFAVPSLLLILNSLAVTLADFGLGTDVLRLPDEQSAHRSRLHLMRSINAGIGVAGVAGWIILDGSAAEVALAIGLIWPCAAEAYVRKSGAIRMHEIRSVVMGEIAGSAVLAGSIIVACVDTSAAVPLLTAGLVGKSLVECATARGWRACFAGEGIKGDQLALWLAQVMAFGVANLDFLAVGLLLGGRAFAVYALAFRLSNALPSQLSYVAGRTASVDLASRPHEQGAVYLRYLRPLFRSGILAGALTMVFAPIAPLLLGDDWSSISWVLVVLAIAIPWRMVLGLGGTLLIVARRSQRLLHVEVVHLVVLGIALLLGGLISFGAIVGVAAAGSVLAVLGYHLVATRVARIDWWTPLAPLAVVSLLAIAVLAPHVSMPV